MQALGLKILHVIPSVSARQGGPSRAIVDIERALTARGLEVTTVTTNDDADGRTLAVRCGEPIVTDTASRSRADSSSPRRTWARFPAS